MLHMLISSIVVILTVMLLSLRALNRPEWLQTSEENVASNWTNQDWMHTVIRAGFFALASAAIAWYFMPEHLINHSWEMDVARSIQAYLAAIVAFNLFIGFVTDTVYRKVDNRITWLSIALAMPPALWFIISFADQATIILFVVILTMAFGAMLFAGRAWGPADGRNIILAVAVLFPVVGDLGFTNYITYVALLTIFVGLCYFFYQLIGLKMPVKKAFVISLPGVPILLLPAWFFVIMGGWAFPLFLITGNSGI